MLNRAQLEEKIQNVVKSLKKKGAEIHSKKILPPATERQLKEAEEVLNFPIPPNTRKFLSELCAGMNFVWTLNDDSLDDEISSFTLGQCEWSLESFTDTGLRDDMTDVWNLKETNTECDRLWMRSLILGPVQNQYLLIDPNDSWKIKLGGDRMEISDLPLYIAEDLPDLLTRWLDVGGSASIKNHCNWAKGPKDARDHKAFVKWLNS